MGHFVATCTPLLSPAHTPPAGKRGGLSANIRKQWHVVSASALAVVGAVLPFRDLTPSRVTSSLPGFVKGCRARSRMYHTWLTERARCPTRRRDGLRPGGAKGACSLRRRLLCQLVPPPSLASDLGGALGSMEHADVKFLAGGRPIYAHRAVLACQSEYFAAMFRFRSDPLGPPRVPCPVSCVPCHLPCRAFPLTTLLGTNSYAPVLCA